MPRPVGNVGSFLLRPAAAKTVRQRHATGPMLNKRKTFTFKKGTHELSRPINAKVPPGKHDRPELWHRHLPGDVRRRPEHDFTSEDRVDKAQLAWAKRGKLQVHMIGGKPERFVCFRCGYPTRSRLVAIKEENWDWRMCYRCYVSTVQQGMHTRI